MIKRINYEAVRIATIGGVIEFKPAMDGYSASFAMASTPRLSHAKTLEATGAALVKDLKSMIECVEADINAFVERNK